MKHKNNQLDDLVGAEPKNPQSNNQRKDNGYTSLWYMYTSIGCMFTTLADISEKSDWMYIPAVGFCLAGVIDASYSLYRSRQNQK